MARRTKVLTIDADGRDKGKILVLTEKDADSGAKWATRAILAIGNTGMDLPDDALSMGFAGLAAIGVKALFRVSAPQLQPLLDELLTCVQLQSPNPAAGTQPIYAGVNCQLEEVKTFLTIYMAVLDLHTGFSTPDAMQTLASRQSATSG